jgi:hypothetical protein
MVSQLEVLQFIRERGHGARWASLGDIARHFEIPEINARGFIARLWRNHAIKPIERRDPLGQEIPLPALAFRITRQGIKRLAYYRRGKVPGSLFDGLLT